MNIATLCFLVRDNKYILLGRKKKKIGAGKWNGYGGMVEKGEEIEEAAIRELREEIGVISQRISLNKVGLITFYFNERPEWEVHVFLIQEWQNQPKETDEIGELRWFLIPHLPYQEMLPADKEWLPLVLSGKKIIGEAYYNTDASLLNNFKYKEVFSFLEPLS